MGKLIMCAGKQAGYPYRFTGVSIPIRNIEELCYVIYNHPFVIAAELYEPKLTDFIENELEMKERAEYLRHLQQSHAGAKDFMVAIFCSCDYYGEQEIKAFLDEYDAYYRLGNLARKKREADRLLREERTKEAAKLYREITEAENISELTDQEFGDVLHNYAVTEMRRGLFRDAAEHFREAYERNFEDETLVQYFAVLKMMGDEAAFNRAIKYYTPRREVSDQLGNIFYMAKNSAEQTMAYRNYAELKELYEAGKIAEYYQATDRILNRWKQEYREN